MRPGRPDRLLHSFKARLLALVAFAVVLPVLLSSLLLGYQLDRQARVAFEHELEAKLAMVTTTLQDADANVAGGVARAASDNTLQLTLDLAMTSQLSRYIDAQRGVLRLSDLVAYDGNGRTIAASRSGADSLPTPWRLGADAAAPSTECTASARLSRQVIACRGDVFLVAVAPVLRVPNVSVGDAAAAAPAAGTLGYLLGATPVAGESVIGLLRQRGVDLPLVWLGDTLVHPLGRLLSPARAPDDGAIAVDFRLDGEPYLGITDRTSFGSVPLAYGVLLPLASLRKALLNSIVLIVGLGLLVAAGTLVAIGLGTRRLLQPVEELKAGAREIESGNLAHRIAISSGDELQALGEGFNSMAAQLQGSYADLERKVQDRTRELADANLAKSRFLAAASHDLRQPLHALNLFVGQLCSARHDTERQEVTEHLAASVTAMNELFDDLLDMAKLDAGLLAPRPAAFEVSRLLERVGNTFSAAAKEKGLRWQVHGHGACVRSDFVLLERIVFNLVSNAIKYTAHGGVLLGCRVRGESLRIEVYDTGSGIPAHLKEHIFGEFVQLEDGQTGRPGAGLGLGLAIVDRLARLLGHPLEVESTLGRGSRFAVTVPRTQASALQPVSAPGPASGLDLLRGKRVVVVDDDRLVRDGMAGMVQSWGAVAIVAATGDDADRGVAALPEPPDLIVSDYHLPDGRTGLDVVTRIRERCRRDIPALIVTGETASELQPLATAAGCLLLHKPVTPMRLRAVASRLMADAAAGAPVTSA